MFIFQIIITVFILAALLLVAGVQPEKSHYSEYELKRRVDLGDELAKLSLTRENMFGDIVSLQRVLMTFLVVLETMLLVVTFGWLVGVLLAVVVALEYGAIAKLRLIRNYAKKLYLMAEPKLFDFIARTPFLFNLIRSVPEGYGLLSDYQLGSRYELEHLIEESNDVLNTEEKKLLNSGLKFNDKLVNSIMTPRSVIDSIKDTEFLGPLILDELHKVGHSRLPVIHGDIDHVVGILNIRSLLTLDKKRSVTAEKAMDNKVYYVREDQTLQHALGAFLRTRHHLFIVVNEFRETVGLLTLEDVIEALIGRKIIDEFDAYDDLRAVALHNPRKNNQPEKREDV